MARSRFIISIALILITLWTIGTLYVSLQKVNNHNLNGRTPELDGEMGRLNDKISFVEKAIKEQAEENKKLLAALQEQLNRMPQIAGALKSSNPKHSQIAVLVFACNRPKALKNHIQQLLDFRPSADRFPILISEDCQHEQTLDVAKSFGAKVTLIEQPDQSLIVLPPKDKKWLGYHKISRHYKWAFNQVFYKLGYNAVIVTEDDLDISEDFFEYFSATLPLLENDPTLMCVSAWNDNGKHNLIQNKSDLLYRTDFFPGLGWMLRKDLWDELSSKWPAAFWDDWMRRPEQRNDRACIRPEISRTSMSLHGKVGVSKGLFFEKHLKHIQLNKEVVKFTAMNLNYLMKSNYDSTFVNYVYKWPSITQEELGNGHLSDGSALPEAIRLTYTDKVMYKNAAKKYGLMDDFRAGVPRTSYRGVVPFIYGSTRVFLAPVSNWNGYDINWN